MKKAKSIPAAFVILALALAANSHAQEPPPKKSAAAVISAALDVSGITAAQIRFHELLAQRDKFAFVEREFLASGRRLLESGKNLEAAALLKMGTEVFPNSYNLLISLGRAYRFAGDYENDRKSISRALALRDSKLLADFLEKNKDDMAETAEDVIDRHLEAIGGRTNQEKIKTIVISYSTLDAVDGEAIITRYYKFPHFVRQDNIPSGSATATDGDKVWSITPRGWREQSGSNWAYVPDIYNDFIGYQARGITYTLLGVEAIDQHITYHLLKRYPDGEERDYYFSAETGLFRMERRDFGMGKDIKSYWDYRRHEGVLIPHLFIVIWDVGFGQTHGGILQDIKINIPLEDSLFRGPEKK